MRNATLAWLLAISVGAAGASATGCARKTHTVRSDHTLVQTAPPTTAVVREEHSIYTHHEEEAEPRGVLSTVVHVVGEVLAWPFRLVGGLLRAIF